jgi:hypothetical protein
MARLAGYKFYTAFKITTFYCVFWFKVKLTWRCSLPLNGQLSEATMLELLESLLFAVVMVPIVMAIILGLIYGLGEVFNIFSKVGHSKENRT